MSSATRAWAPVAANWPDGPTTHVPGPSTALPPGAWQHPAARPIGRPFQPRSRSPSADCRGRGRHSLFFSIQGPEVPRARLLGRRRPAAASEEPGEPPRVLACCGLVRQPERGSPPASCRSGRGPRSIQDLRESSLPRPAVAAYSSSLRVPRTGCSLLVQTVSSAPARLRLSCSWYGQARSAAPSSSSSGWQGTS